MTWWPQTATAVAGSFFIQTIVLLHGNVHVRALHAAASSSARESSIPAVIAAVCSRQTLAHTHTHTHSAPDCRAADAVAVAVPQKNIV
eukprot:COSAG06_NODE_2566_length_6656_cov_30.339485_2_plen_88_part_00